MIVGPKPGQQWNENGGFCGAWSVQQCALAHGARHVTTLDYARITTNHPNLTALTPRELFAAGGARAARHHARAFGAVLSFSSVEHSGLGRCGDALDPRDDIARF